MHLLYDLKSGDLATISGIKARYVEQSLEQRLAALGFRVGKRIQVMRKASFNGPLHVRIGSTDIILRESEAKLIEVHPSTAESDYSQHATPSPSIKENQSKKNSR
ncbi:MAG: FeoA family protein [Methylophilaceae bacterium]|nr:FeoA family protein [Methylophilaceae bacterium]